MPKSDFKLNRWDCELIAYLKNSGSERPTIEGVKEIWSRRNCAAPQYIPTSCIVDRMLLILEARPAILGPWQDFVKDLHPENQWKFSLAAPNGHWESWLVVLSSRLMLAKVVDLPGYREYLDAQRPQSVLP